MKKRFTALLLMITLAVAAVLSGCTLFVHNYDRDYAQIIAIVNPITFEWREGDQDYSYTSEKFEVRKSDLINSYISNGSQLSQQYEPKEVFETLLNQIINRKILVEAATQLMKEGKLIVFNRQNPAEGDIYRDIKDSITDMNTIWRNVYSVIDNQIFAFGNEILKEQKLPERTKIGSATTETEFAVMPEFDAIDHPEMQETVPFSPEIDANPPFAPASLLSSDVPDYLELEATARLVRTLIERIEGMTLTAEEKVKLKADKDRLEQILNVSNVPLGKRNLYLRLNEFFVVEKAVYKDQYDIQMISRLQQYLTENTDVMRSEIFKHYEETVAQQINLYTDNISAFEAALEGSDPVLYHPTGGYFYVKQVLVPFSAEQTAQLDALKAAGTPSKVVNAYREQLASMITARAHDTGDFYGPEIPFKQVYAEIKAGVDSIALSPNLSERAPDVYFYRERAFERFIYKYNTDPGAFGQAKGYLIKPEGNNWVAEFLDGANELRKKGLGAMSEPILTDFGYHILYLSKIVNPTTTNGVGIYEYETALASRTYYEIIEKLFEANYEENNYGNFERAIITRYNKDDKTIIRYVNRYKDLYE